VLELATNSTVTVNVPPADSNLVYVTLLLVAVSAFSLYLSARQNKETQKLMAEQTQAVGKQVDQAVAQTTLQQRQFEALLKQQGRRRIQEMIQVILSPTIMTLDSYVVRSKEAPLELRGPLTAFLTDKNARFYERSSYWVFRDFQVEYRDLADKMMLFDKEAVESVRLKYLEMHDALLKAVHEAVPEIVKNSASKVIVDDVIPTFIVEQAVLPYLRGLPEQVANPQQKQLWEEGREQILERVNRPEVVKLVGNLKAANGACADASEVLNKELVALRDNLGKEYGLTHDEYFVPETPTLYLEEG